VTTRIALLRGINVGGRHKVPMKELTALFVRLGATRVQTYIQSGNVVFSGLEAETALSLSTQLTEEFGFEIPVVLRDAATLRLRVAASPFAALPAAEPLPDGKLPESHHLAFCDGAPQSPGEPDAYLPDRFAIAEGGPPDVFLYTPKGLGKTRLDGTFMRRLKVPATVRNMRTVQALIALAASFEG
jgi:uncharacterized protein (DUF1697 family)